MDSVVSYIRSVFLEHIGEVPRLGWIADGRFIIATETHDSLALYGARGVPSVARYLGRLTADEQLASTSRNRIACEAPDTGISAYRIDPAVDEKTLNRVLYTSRPGFGSEQGMMRERGLSSTELQRVADILKWDVEGSVFVHRAYHLASAATFYSVHLRYGVDRNLAAEALVMHTGNGSIIGYALDQYSSDEVLCDGCSLPTWETRSGFAYRVENMFELSGFMHPVLLINSSTFEGAALSMVTFAPEGTLSEYRQYEYVVNCGP